MGTFFIIMGGWAMKIIDKFSIKIITLLTVDEDLPKNGIIFY